MYNFNEDQATTVAVEALRREASYQFGLFNDISQFARVSMCSHINQSKKVQANRLCNNKDSTIA